MEDDSKQPPDGTQKDLGQVRAAFESLPAKVTIADIAAATGRTEYGVRNWVNQKKDPFPAPTPESGRTHYRDRDAVLAWYEKQPFATEAGRQGPGRTRHTVSTAVPVAPRMTRKQLADTLGVIVEAIAGHIRKHPPGSETPFPSPGSDGLLDWEEVKAWFLQRASAPRTAPVLSQRDENGLTPREREVLALVSSAEAEGKEVTSQWLAGELDVVPDSAARLLRAVARFRTAD